MDIHDLKKEAAKQAEEKMANRNAEIQAERLAAEARIYKLADRLTEAIEDAVKHAMAEGLHSVKGFPRWTLDYYYDTMHTWFTSKPFKEAIKRSITGKLFLRKQEKCQYFKCYDGVDSFKLNSTDYKRVRDIVEKNISSIGFSSHSVAHHVVFDGSHSFDCIYVEAFWD